MRELYQHRLGRVSFRSIKQKRDYLRHRKTSSWLYMSRLAALKEFAFMKVFTALGNWWQSLGVVWTRISSSPANWLQSALCGDDSCGRLLTVSVGTIGVLIISANVRELKHPDKVYDDLMNLVVRLAEHGLIHCDFNEFNLMINDKEEITLIDFPQMVSTSHPNAEEYIF